MTHEETIQEIKEMIEDININEIKDHDSDILLQSWIRSWRGRMKTLVDQLGKELCSDTISRQAAQEGLNHLMDSDGFRDSVGYVQKSLVRNMLNNLAFVQPKIKTGHWILLSECSNNGYYCSCCRKKLVKEGWSDTVKKIKYCPNCGAKMIDLPDINDGKLSEISTDSESENKK